MEFLEKKLKQIELEEKLYGKSMELHKLLLT